MPSFVSAVRPKFKPRILVEIFRLRTVLQDNTEVYELLFMDIIVSKMGHKQVTVSPLHLST